LLKELIRSTVFSAGLDDSRPVLAGVLFDLSGDRLTLSSADGFRLSIAHETLAEPVAEHRQALVPASSLKEFLAVAPDQGSLEMRLEPGQVTFRLQDLEGPLQALEVVSLLLDGQFPDFAGVVPKDYATRVIVDRPALLRACRQALIFARESSNLGIFKIAAGSEGEPGQIVISGHSSETGSNSSTIAAEVEGEGLEIGFNLRYLQEALQIIRAPSVLLGLTTPESPGALKAVGDEAFTHVLMPMHL
jgi:DNA polymerase-3 subunit beta